MEFENLKQLAVHQVGNKTLETPLVLTKSLIELEDDLKQTLSTYFLSSFKREEFYRFFHDSDLSLNEVYTYASAIFENPENLLSQSINLAKHLYNQSNHPKIKDGEFYVAYFEDCIYKGENVEAIGLFKSENKDTYLEVEVGFDGFDIQSKQGININKLDKGCLIFNTEKENGYVLSVLDNTNKSNEALYWKDDFLRVFVLNNEFHQTNQFLGITKQFVTQQLADDFEVTKTDQIDLLNRSVDYFKNHESFDKQEFVEEVFHHQNIIDSFQTFDQNFRQQNELELDDQFEISAQAVKKQARVFKSVLKLDKNFHIYIHGDRELIEQGTDENGRKFYKIYYNEES